MASAGPGAASRGRVKSGDIQTTIAHPGTIKINVEGAFIVDESVLPELEDAEEFEYVHDTKDIRLPNHTAVVSHIAVDVRMPQTQATQISTTWPNFGD